MAFTAGGGIGRISRADLDALINQRILAVDGALWDCHNTKVNLFDPHSDAEFEAVSGVGPTGYNTTDSPHPIVTIKSAFTDLDKLWQIYTGAINLASAQDFRAAGKLIVWPPLR